MMVFFINREQVIGGLLACFAQAQVDVYARHYDTAVRREMSELTMPGKMFALKTSTANHVRLATDPTLRQWLTQEEYHFGLAPIVFSTSLYLNMLTLLESEGLTGHLLESFSGTSNAGLVASLWGTRGSKFATEHVKIWGKPPAAWSCHGNCSAAEAYYLKWAEGPVQSESDATISFGQEGIELAQEASMPLASLPVASQESTLHQRAVWLYWLQMMHVPKSFQDIKLPIVITGFDTDKSLGIMMREGDIQAAVVGAASIVSFCKGIRMGEFLIGDGYAAESFGFKGYDALFPPDATVTELASQGKTYPPRRIFNIVGLDSKEQMDCASVNWTSLSHYTYLRQSLTFLVDYNQKTSSLGMARRQKHLKIPYLREQHLLQSGTQLIMQALDEKVPLFNYVHADTYAYFCSQKSLQLPELVGASQSVPYYVKVFNAVRKLQWTTAVKGYKTIAAFRSDEIHWPLDREHCILKVNQIAFGNFGDQQYMHPSKCLSKTSR